MARIAGITLPSEKRIEIGLTYIYGIGRSRSNMILEKVKINKDKRSASQKESSCKRAENKNKCPHQKGTCTQ